MNRVSKLVYGFGVMTAMFALSSSVNGQSLVGDDLTLTLGIPAPFVRFIQVSDGINNTADWLLAGGDQDFRVDDRLRLTTPFSIESGARNNALLIDQDGRVGLGDANPGGVLDINALNLTGSILFNPGLSSLASITVFEAEQAAELQLQTFDPTKSSFVTLASPGVEFAVLANSIGQPKFTIRDIVNGRNAFTIFPSALHNNTLSIRDNQVGIGFNNPSHPLHVQSGAHCTAGGVWRDACSRERKDNILPLDESSAIAALNELSPVTYHYKVAPEDKCVGFIAEDVPELVASPDRKSLATMDISAVLTKVVQSQQGVIEAQNSTIEEQGTQIEELVANQEEQSEMIAELAQRLTELQSQLEQR